MGRLTKAQIRFLEKHGIPLNETFDATGHSRASYSARMRELQKVVAYGVTRCIRSGHSLRSRHGTCIQCFGYLWQPKKNMFCKPTVTQDFAQRIGHKFQYDYDSEISERVYVSLMDLADHTLAEIKPLGAEDYIDVQTFIYVVGGYTEQDRPA